MIHCRHRSLLPCLVSLVAVLIGANIAWAQSNASDAAISLRPQWHQGQTSRYHFRTSRVQKVTMSAGGKTRSMGTTIHTQGDMTWKVEKVHSDGDYTCTLTVDWMTADLTSSTGQSAHNDSRKGQGDAPAIQDMLKAVTDVPLTVEVAADGSITKVSGVDVMRGKAEDADRVPKALDFVETASELVTIPGAPSHSKPGDDWAIDFKWRHPMGFLQEHMTYTFGGLEHIAGIPVATVTGQADLKLDVDRSKLPSKGPKIDIGLTDGSYQSQIMFDLSRHEAVGRNSVEKQIIDTTLSFQGHTLTRRLEQTVQSQVLRIAEGGT